MNNTDELIQQVKKIRLGLFQRGRKRIVKENLLKNLKSVFSTDKITCHGLFQSHFLVVENLEAAIKLGLIKESSSLALEIENLLSSLISIKANNLVEELQKETVQDDTPYKLPRQTL